MFDAGIYKKRREKLKETVTSGLLLFLGNEETPMNYAANPYPFRQDSSFLYFFGLDSPGLAGIVDIDQGCDLLYGDDVDMEDIIWMGTQPLLRNRGLDVGVEKTFPFAKLTETLAEARSKGREIHFLPPYRPESQLRISQMLEIGPETVKDKASVELIKAVVTQRSVKIKEEIEQMDIAQNISLEMYDKALEATKPGIFESEVAGLMEGVVLQTGNHIAFPTILTVNGQILHNHYHGNRMEAGQLLVIDSGAESPLHYASDITRTFPVSGRFEPRQKDIYTLVLHAQETAIQAIGPGVMYKEIHLKSAGIIASGLKELGLMKGDVEEAVQAGAHALFFPHGLGHMIGLDVHDMEDIGEDYVGYDETVQRSDQFGLAYLRLAKTLQPGYVLTVEPGIYFIPALIDKWVGENRFAEFINYEKLASFREFGGIRIEDEVLVTENGQKVLDKGIPKSIKDIEDRMGG
jgi:Xaa-Pro aminopeptidase